MATSILSAIQYTQQLCQTDAYGIGSALGLAFWNDSKADMTRVLVERGIDAAQTQEAYRDLTVPSTAGYPATYAWPSDMYRLKTVEVNWSDNTPQNYLQTTALDVANIQNVSFSWLRSNQPQSQPLLDNRGDTFEIMPTPQISNSNGIRIFYYLTTTEDSDVGTAITYPFTLDYRANSCKMASLYYKSQNDTTMAQVYEQEYMSRLDKIVKILAPNSQQPIQPTPLAITGWNY